MVQAPALTASRRLLRHLRDVMAGGGSGQERLNQIVRIVAREMVAEVCSVYVRRAGEVLELFATEGLNPDAVHRTRLIVGEGLVGNIAAYARPLALADAQAHPQFAYRPETGEEIYHSLAGVPILRGGRVVGVLIVQNRTRRHYTEEEIETLQIIAMVLAELIASGELISPTEIAQTDGIAMLPLRLEGVQISRGAGIGRAVFHHRNVAIREVVAEDPEAELARLDDALDGMRRSLDRLFTAADIGEQGEHLEILEAYRMFAEDEGWIRRIREAVATGLTAAAAVERVQSETRARLSQVTDPYLRERLHDLEDLANRLLQHLAGDRDEEEMREALAVDHIVVARNMGPAELLEYDRRYLKGVVLEEGSPTSHAAIVARALDIPVVGRVDGIVEKVDPSDTVIVDGDHGEIFVRPGEDVVHAFRREVRRRQRRQAAYAALRDQPAVTLDGVAITLNMNAGLLIDMPYLHSAGADGVGLYRTEIPFMVQADFPDVEEQTKFYRRVVELAEGKPVTFRTLDIGGDKLLPFLGGQNEENPAMGWRSIRIALDRPAMLRQQLRALIRATAGGELRVMFPMVAEVSEFSAARHLLDRELARERAAGAPTPEAIRVGAMLEVPSLAWQLDALSRRIDFLSVGSNDLLQFLFASDRSNPRLAERYDALSPLVLGFLRAVIERCRALRIPLSLCGDMASRPLEAMALIGLGFREISAAAPAIGAIKSMVRTIKAAPLAEYVAALRQLPDHSVRGRLRAYAHDHGVLI